MLLPYDTTLSYWAMAVPEFEWQLEPTANAQSAGPGPTSDACADSTAGVDPAAGAGCAGCDDAGDAASHQASRPRLRLVMTGMQWVVVPYWSPRENAYWNLLADDARDTDMQRNESNLRQSKRPVHIAAPADPEATGEAPQ
jgi:hypothetical protein